MKMHEALRHAEAAQAAAEQECERLEAEATEAEAEEEERRQTAAEQALWSMPSTQHGTQSGGADVERVEQIAEAEVSADEAELAAVLMEAAVRADAEAAGGWGGESSAAQHQRLAEANLASMHDQVHMEAAVGEAVAVAVEAERLVGIGIGRGARGAGSERGAGARAAEMQRGADELGRMQRETLSTRGGGEVREEALQRAERRIKELESASAATAAEAAAEAAPVAAASGFGSDSLMMSSSRGLSSWAEARAQGGTRGGARGGPPPLGGSAAAESAIYGVDDGTASADGWGGEGAGGEGSGGGGGDGGGGGGGGGGGRGGGGLLRAAL